SVLLFFFSSRRRHTRSKRDWSSDVCSSDLDRVPKSVVDASEVGLTVGHDPKKEKSILALNPTIADNEIGKFQWAADKDNQYYARSEERRVGKESRCRKAR